MDQSYHSDISMDQSIYNYQPKPVTTPVLRSKHAPLSSQLNRLNKLSAEMSAPIMSMPNPSPGSRSLSQSQSMPTHTPSKSSSSALETSGFLRPTSLDESSRILHNGVLGNGIPPYSAFPTESSQPTAPMSSAPAQRPIPQRAQNPPHQQAPLGPPRTQDAPRARPLPVTTQIPATQSAPVADPTIQLESVQLLLETFKNKVKVELDLNLDMIQAKTTALRKDLLDYVDDAVQSVSSNDGNRDQLWKQQLLLTEKKFECIVSDRVDETRADIDRLNTVLADVQAQCNTLSAQILSAPIFPENGKSGKSLKSGNSFSEEDSLMAANISQQIIELASATKHEITQMKQHVEGRLKHHSEALLDTHTLLSQLLAKQTADNDKATSTLRELHSKLQQEHRSQLEDGLRDLRVLHGDVSCEVEAIARQQELIGKQLKRLEQRPVSAPLSAVTQLEQRMQDALMQAKAHVRAVERKVQLLAESRDGSGKNIVTGKSDIPDGKNPTAVGVGLAVEMVDKMEKVDLMHTKVTRLDASVDSISKRQKDLEQSYQQLREKYQNFSEKDLPNLVSDKVLESMKDESRKKEKEKVSEAQEREKVTQGIYAAIDTTRMNIESAIDKTVQGIFTQLQQFREQLSSESKSRLQYSQEISRTVDDLSATVVDQTSRVNGTIDQINAMHTRLSQQTEQLAAVDQKLDELEMRETADSSHLDALSLRVGGVEQHLSVMDDKLIDASQQLTETTQRLTATEAKVKAVEDKLNASGNADASVSLLTEAMDAHQEVLHELSENVQTQSEDFEQLAMKVDDQESILDELQPEVESLRHEMDEQVLPVIEEHGTAINELKAKLETHAAWREEHEDKLQQLSEKVGQTAPTVAAVASGDTVADKLAHNGANTVDVAALAQLEGVLEANKQHDAAIVRHTTAIDAHGATLAAHDTAIAEHATVIQEHATDIQEHSTVIREHGAAITSLHNQVDGCVRDVTTVKDKLAAWEGKWEKLEKIPDADSQSGDVALSGLRASGRGAKSVGLSNTHSAAHATQEEAEVGLQGGNNASTIVEIAGVKDTLTSLQQVQQSHAEKIDNVQDAVESVVASTERLQNVVNSVDDKVEAMQQSFIDISKRVDHLEQGKPSVSEKPRVPNAPVADVSLEQSPELVSQLQAATETATATSDELHDRITAADIACNRVSVAQSTLTDLIARTETSVDAATQLLDRVTAEKAQLHVLLGDIDDRAGRGAALVGQLHAAMEAGENTVLLLQESRQIGGGRKEDSEQDDARGEVAVSSGINVNSQSQASEALLRDLEDQLQALREHHARTEAAREEEVRRQVTAEITKLSKTVEDTVRAELRAEMKAEMSAMMRAISTEIRDELKQSLQQELRAELKEELREELFQEWRQQFSKASPRPPQPAAASVMPNSGRQSSRVAAEKPILSTAVTSASVNTAPVAADVPEKTETSGKSNFLTVASPETTLDIEESLSLSLDDNTVKPPTKETLPSIPEAAVKSEALTVPPTQPQPQLAPQLELQLQSQSQPEHQTQSQPSLQTQNQPLAVPAVTPHTVSLTAPQSQPQTLPPKTVSHPIMFATDVLSSADLSDFVYVGDNDKHDDNRDSFHAGPQPLHIPSDTPTPTHDDNADHRFHTSISAFNDSLPETPGTVRPITVEELRAAKARIIESTPVSQVSTMPARVDKHDDNLDNMANRNFDAAGALINPAMPAPVTDSQARLATITEVKPASSAVPEMSVANSRNGTEASEAEYYDERSMDTGEEMFMPIGAFRNFASGTFPVISPSQTNTTVSSDKMNKPDDKDNKSDVNSRVHVVPAAAPVPAFPQPVDLEDKKDFKPADDEFDLGDDTFGDLVDEDDDDNHFVFTEKPADVPTARASMSPAPAETHAETGAVNDVATASSNPQTNAATTTAVVPSPNVAQATPTTAVPAEPATAVAPAAPAAMPPTAASTVATAAAAAATSGADVANAPVSIPPPVAADAASVDATATEFSVSLSMSGDDVPVNVTADAHLVKPHASVPADGNSKMSTMVVNVDNHVDEPPVEPDAASLDGTDEIIAAMDVLADVDVIDSSGSGSAYESEASEEQENNSGKTPSRKMNITRNSRGLSPSRTPNSLETRFRESLPMSPLRLSNHTLLDATAAPAQGRIGSPASPQTLPPSPAALAVPIASLRALAVPTTVQKIPVPELRGISDLCVQAVAEESGGDMAAVEQELALQQRLQQQRDEDLVKLALKIEREREREQSMMLNQSMQSDAIAGLAQADLNSSHVVGVGADVDGDGDSLLSFSSISGSDGSEYTVVEEEVEEEVHDTDVPMHHRVIHSHGHTHKHDTAGDLAVTATHPALTVDAGKATAAAASSAATGNVASSAAAPDSMDDLTMGSLLDTVDEAPPARVDNAVKPLTTMNDLTTILTNDMTAIPTIVDPHDSLSAAIWTRTEADKMYKQDATLVAPAASNNYNPTESSTLDLTDLTMDTSTSDNTADNTANNHTNTSTSVQHPTVAQTAVAPASNTAIPPTAARTAPVNAPKTAQSPAKPAPESPAKTTVVAKPAAGAQLTPNKAAADVDTSAEFGLSDFEDNDVLDALHDHSHSTSGSSNKSTQSETPIPTLHQKIPDAVVAAPPTVAGKVLENPFIRKPVEDSQILDPVLSFDHTSISDEIVLDSIMSDDEDNHDDNRNNTPAIATTTPSTHTTTEPPTAVPGRLDPGKLAGVATRGSIGGMLPMGMPLPGMLGGPGGAPSLAQLKQAKAERERAQGGDAALSATDADNIDKRVNEVLEPGAIASPVRKPSIAAKRKPITIQPSGISENFSSEKSGMNNSRSPIPNDTILSVDFDDTMASSVPANNPYKPQTNIPTNTAVVNQHVDNDYDQYDDNGGDSLFSLETEPDSVLEEYKYEDQDPVNSLSKTHVATPVKQPLSYTAATAPAPAPVSAVKTEPRRPSPSQTPAAHFTLGKMPEKPLPEPAILPPTPAKTGTSENSELSQSYDENAVPLGVPVTATGKNTRENSIPARSSQPGEDESILSVGSLEFDESIDPTGNEHFSFNVANMQSRTQLTAVAVTQGQATPAKSMPVVSTPSNKAPEGDSVDDVVMHVVDSSEFDDDNYATNIYTSATPAKPNAQPHITANPAGPTTAATSSAVAPATAVAAPSATRTPAPRAKDDSLDLSTASFGSVEIASDDDDVPLPAGPHVTAPRTGALSSTATPLPYMAQMMSAQQRPMTMPIPGTQVGAVPAVPGQGRAVTSPFSQDFGNSMNLTDSFLSQDNWIDEEDFVLPGMEN